MGTEEGAGGGVDRKITIGVCVMEKKVKCSPEVFFPFFKLSFVEFFLFWIGCGLASEIVRLDFFCLQVFSAPMGQIMDRLQAFGEFEVWLLSAELILILWFHIMFWCILSILLFVTAF